MKLQDGYPVSSADRSTADVDVRRLHLFDPSVQVQIAIAAAMAPEIEDLAESFPAALFALATGYGTAVERNAALECIANGASLRTVSRALGLPWWLRKLPASAFIRPIPKLPDDPSFAQAVANIVTRSNAAAADWLELISIAAQSCDAKFALWVARQSALRSESSSPIVMATLCAWAWTSLHPQTDAAKLLRRPWHPDMGLKRALEERSAWLQRVALHASLTAFPSRDWVADGDAGGLQFRQLRDAPAFIAAAAALDNCLDQYAEPIAAGAATVFGVYRQEKLIACIELRPHADHLGMPGVAQIKGPRNRRSSVEVWRAAYAWLGNHIVAPRPILGAGPTNAARVKAIDAVWLPYVKSLRGTGLTEQTSILLRNAVLQRLPRLVRQRRTAYRAPALSALTGDDSRMPASPATLSYAGASPRRR